MVPQRYPDTQYLSIWSLNGQKDFEDVTEDLDRRDYFRAQSNHKYLYKREAGGRESEEKV